MNIYSIFDRVAGVYSEPFYEKSDALAVRRFQFCLSQSSMIKADCDLFRIGVYDEVSGHIDACPKPEFIRRYEEEKE